jgi:ribosomal protein S25
METITLKTLGKVEKILAKEDKAISVNYLVQKCGINMYAVRLALKELGKRGKLCTIKTSNVDLYSYNKYCETNGKN